MALQKVSPGLLPADNYKRINAAIDAIDTALAQIPAGDSALAQQIQDVRVNISQFRDAFGQEVHDRIDAERILRDTIDIGFRNTNGTLAGVAQNAADAIAAEQQARSNALTAAVQNLNDLIAAETAARLAAVIPSLDRPGDGPQSFTRGSLSGLDLPPLPDSMIAFGENGYVARVIGSDIIAARTPVAIEAGRRYRPRFVVQRRRNVADPANHAIRCGVAWLDQTGNLLRGSTGISIVRDVLNARTSDGRIQVGTTLARYGVGAPLAAPAGAVYARAFVQTFGSDDVLNDIEVLKLGDVTDLAVLPDLSADLVASVQALTAQNIVARLQTVEAAQGSPNGQIYPSRGDAAAASIPSTVTNIETRGLSTPGDGQSALYRRGTQAQAAATDGSFQSADGAYWIFSEGISTRVQKGAVGTEVVESRGVRQAVADFVGPDYYDFDWGWPGLGKPKRNGIDDDSPIYNAIAANKVAMKIIPGVIYAKSTLVHELRNTKISVPGGWQATQVNRDLGMTGPTMRIGADQPGKSAGAVEMDPLFIIHPFRLGFTGLTLPGRLTNDEAALEVYGLQGGDIGLFWIGHARGIDVYGGDGYTLRPYFAGGLWDNLNTGLQETKSAVRFRTSKYHGHGKTAAIQGGQLIGGYESAPRSFLVGQQTLNRKEAIGARRLIEVESLEYGYIDNSFVGGANEHSIAVIPTSADCVLQSMKITSSDIDQSRLSGLYARRDAADFPVLQTLLMSDTELNGVYEGLHAVWIDDAGGFRSVRNFGMTNIVTRAHLGSPFYLRGVDGGFASLVRACGYNEAGNRNAAGPGLQRFVAGMYITGLTRNFRRSFCTFGADANDDDAANKCEFGVIDDTAPSANNRYFADMALNLGAPNFLSGALRAGGTLETSP